LNLRSSAFIRGKSSLSLSLLAHPWELSSGQLSQNCLNLRSSAFIRGKSSLSLSFLAHPWEINQVAS
ncbi:MAG TPA: hypothetical protein PKM56_19325, partial [Candidatus Rifleibacterium sp.]|nr:hypothetical protein [Candidatus Rifleibacterium sp.]